MSFSVEEHVIYQITNAPIREYPYPHIYVEPVFPTDFYAELRRNWPNATHLVSLASTGRVPKGAYPERFIMPVKAAALESLPTESRAFWTGLEAWMLKGRFAAAVLDKFAPYIRQRFGPALNQASFSPELMVVRDHTNYKLGPHTDAAHKLISLLFYCPDDDSTKHLGTSIHTPLDPTFRCEGGPFHYPHERFTKVATMEFRPNALFAFFKTDNSFHGVDPIHDADVLRDLMLYDIRVSIAPDEPSPNDGKSSSSIGAAMLKRILRLQK